VTKLLIALLAALAGAALWQRGRLARRPRQPARQPPGRCLPIIVPCAHCGTHVPEGEAVTGRQGSYCCASHRRAAEGA
jgi:uncharacterized protein